MPQPRKHKDNAARQKAYRDRKKARMAGEPLLTPAASTPGTQTLVNRVMAADAAARGREA